MSSKYESSWGRAISDVVHEIAGESRDDREDRHKEREQDDRDASNRKSDQVSDH